MKKWWKKIINYFKKQFTVEKILDKYADRLVEIVLDKVMSAVNDQQKGRLAATDIQISHESVTNKEGVRIDHVFIIKLTMDRDKLIAVLKNK